MNLLKNLQSETKFSRSPKISERRRVLFPTTEKDIDTDSDLGHISPLSNYTNSDEENASSSVASPSKTQRLTELIQQQVVCTPTNRTYSCSESMSPLYLSPFTTNEINPISFYNNKKHNNNSSIKLSPTQSLKTPHETINNGNKIPKLIRKSILDSINGECGVGGNKRKLSPLNTPEQKVLKLDTKNSKVRTALFPESESVISTKSFYSTPNTLNIISDKRTFNIRTVNIKAKNSCKGRMKRRYGQINAGVTHKIRKPKKKKPNKPIVPKSSNDTFEDDKVLTEYLEDLKAIEQRTSLIENKENCKVNETSIKVQHDTPSDNKKKPASPTSETNPKKKFFRSRDSISTAINPLNTKQSTQNKIVLEAFSSVSNNENSIILHPVPNNRTNAIRSQDGQMMLSPTSQMCNMASGLAINSPKKAKNLTTILENMPNANGNVFNKISIVPEVEDSSKKLYPIFYPEYQKKLSIQMKLNNKSKQIIESDKKFFSSALDQMILDAGQKRFGLIQCSECEFLYHVGDANDEILHLNYHRSRNIFKFSGWKNERIVENYNINERVIQILPGDSMYWWKKVKDVLHVVDGELGFYNLEADLNAAQVFLYIKNKMIVGCLVALHRLEAYQLLSTGDDNVDVCSQISYPIKCGVSRIWVSSNNRYQGIASSMMNCLKKFFICGTLLRNCDIALSAPTEMGKNFGKKYFKTDNFLVFCE